MNIEHILTGITQLGTLWILWALVALSVLGLGIIVERSICFATSRANISELSVDVGRMIHGGQWERLEKRLAESPSFEARVALAGLKSRNPESANEHMLAATEGIRIELDRNLAFLGTVGSNAPFVGLLGTVIGIVGAFQQLDQSQGALTDGLMSSIGEALVATAVGLLVALPAIAAFNIFRRVVQKRLAQTDSLRRSVIAHMLGLKESAAARELGDS